MTSGLTNKGTEKFPFLYTWTPLDTGALLLLHFISLVCFVAARRLVARILLKSVENTNHSLYHWNTMDLCWVRHHPLDAVWSVEKYFSSDITGKKYAFRGRSWTSWKSWMLWPPFTRPWRHFFQKNKWIVPCCFLFPSIHFSPRFSAPVDIRERYLHHHSQ